MQLYPDPSQQVSLNWGGHSRWAFFEVTLNHRRIMSPGSRCHVDDHDFEASDHTNREGGRLFAFLRTEPMSPDQMQPLP